MLRRDPFVHRKSMSGELWFGERPGQPLVVSRGAVNQVSHRLFARPRFTFQPLFAIGVGVNKVFEHNFDQFLETKDGCAQRGRRRLNLLLTPGIAFDGLLRADLGATAAGGDGLAESRTISRKVS